MRDPDLLIYFREEGGGLVMGGYERDSAPWSLRDGGRGLDEIPPDFNGRLLEDDWDRFEEIVVNSRKRVPAMEDVKVTRLINGPEAFTPDGEFCLGETAVRGFFVAAGFCAHGLAGAGGIGKVMAEWIVEGEPSLDLWHMDIRRFGEHYRSPRYSLARTREVYETYYDIKYPNHEREAGRPLRTSPAYPWHERARRGRSARSRAGSASTGTRANEAAGDESLRPRGWAGMHWSPAIGAEHRACREAAALFDESLVREARGERAGVGRVPRAAVRRTASRARSGGSPTRRCSTAAAGSSATSPSRGWRRTASAIVTGTAFGNHDLAWIRSHLPAAGSADVRVADVTSQWACFALWGPRARDVLAGCTTADLANAAFPYMTCREIDVGDVPGPRAARDLRRASWAGSSTARPSSARRCGGRCGTAGQEHGLVAGGYRAIDSLRLEKGYRVWGADITPDEHPFQAGLGFAVKLDKGEFIGREALLRAREDGRAGRGCAASCSTTRAPSRSPTSRCGSTARSLGRVTSGGYGYTVGASIAYAYLPARARRARAPRSRSRSSASGSAAASRASRSTTRRARACAADAARAG